MLPTHQLSAARSQSSTKSSSASAGHRRLWNASNTLGNRSKPLSSKRTAWNRQHHPLLRHRSPQSQTHRYRACCHAQTADKSGHDIRRTARATCTSHTKVGAASKTFPPTNWGNATGHSCALTPMAWMSVSVDGNHCPSDPQLPPQNPGLRLSTNRSHSAVAHQRLWCPTATCRECHHHSDDDDHHTVCVTRRQGLATQQVNRHFQTCVKPALASVNRTAIADSLTPLDEI